MSKNQMNSDNSQQAERLNKLQAERLNKLHAIGVITHREWRDGHRELLGMLKLADYNRAGPGQVTDKPTTNRAQTPTDLMQ